MSRVRNHWGRRNVLIMSQVLSSVQYICTLKTLGSNVVAPNLFLTSGLLRQSESLYSKPERLILKHGSKFETQTWSKNAIQGSRLRLASSNRGSSCRPKNFGLIIIGVREGILLGGRKKVALKMTICPENNNLPQK